MKKHVEAMNKVFTEVFKNDTFTLATATDPIIDVKQYLAWATFPAFMEWEKQGTYPFLSEDGQSIEQMTLVDAAKAFLQEYELSKEEDGNVLIGGSRLKQIRDTLVAKIDHYKNEKTNNGQDIGTEVSKFIRKDDAGNLLSSAEPFIKHCFGNACTEDEYRLLLNSYGETFNNLFSDLKKPNGYKYTNNFKTKIIGDNDQEVIAVVEKYFEKPTSNIYGEEMMAIFDNVLEDIEIESKYGESSNGEDWDKVKPAEFFDAILEGLFENFKPFADAVDREREYPIINEEGNGVEMMNLEDAAETLRAEYVAGKLLRGSRLHQIYQLLDYTCALAPGLGQNKALDFNLYMKNFKESSPDAFN